MSWSNSTWEDNFDYLPKVINPAPDKTESTPKMNDFNDSDHLKADQSVMTDEDNINDTFPMLGSKEASWYPFYSSGAETDDNPGTDEDHNTTDTDNVEEDYDADYGGPKPRPKTQDLSKIFSTGGVNDLGAIASMLAEGPHGNDNIHYGDDEESEE